MPESGAGKQQYLQPFVVEALLYDRPTFVVSSSSRIQLIWVYASYCLSDKLIDNKVSARSDDCAASLQDPTGASSVYVRRPSTTPTEDQHALHRPHHPFKLLTADRKRRPDSG